MTFDSYMEALVPFRRNRVQALIDLILALYPQAQVSMKYKMPTFEHQEGWVAIASQKNYVSLYTCASQHIEQFKSRHPKIKTGTGCINLKDKDELPIEDLKDVVRSAMEFAH